MKMNEVFMRTFRTLLTLGVLSTAMIAQDLMKPSAAMKDDPPADASVSPAVATTTTMPAQTSPAQMPTVKDTTDLLIDRIIGREHFMMESMSHLSPMLETYVQNMKPDAELGQ